MIEGILIEGLIYGIMVLGVFVTFRVLNFADMTVDGSFPLGGAVMAVLLLKGVPIFAAVMLAAICGMIAGLITALIHTRLKVPDLLAGILTMTMLYSVNLRIMSDRANISLLRVETVFSWVEGISGGNAWVSVALLVIILLVAKNFLVPSGNVKLTMNGDKVLEVASGKKTKAEEKGFREISIFKDGVML